MSLPSLPSSVPLTKDESYNEIRKKGISINPVIVWFEIDEQGTQQNIIDRRAENIEPSFDDILLKAFVFDYDHKKEIEWRCPIKDAKYGVVFSNKDDRKETYEMTKIARRYLKEITISYREKWKDIEDVRDETIRQSLKEAVDKAYPAYERYHFKDDIVKLVDIDKVIYRRTFRSLITIEASYSSNEIIEVCWIWKGERYPSLQRVLYEIQTNFELLRIMIE